MLFVPKWVILLGSVGRMYSRVRFSRWLQKLSGARGGVAAAGTLAAVLAVLLGFGAAGAFTAPGPGTRGSAAAAAAGAGGAAGGSGPAGAQPAGSGSRAPSAP